MIDPPLLPIMVPIAGTQNGAESGKWGRSDGEGWRDGGWVNKGVEREREIEREEGNTPQISGIVCTLKAELPPQPSLSAVSSVSNESKAEISLCL